MPAQGTFTLRLSNPWEVYMSTTRISIVLSLLAGLLAPASRAQLGKNVSIPAGSDADHQMSAINAADPSQKLALIDDFSKAHPEGDLQIAADEQYVNYYINAKQYDKAMEYGDKLFTLDPDNYTNAVNMVRAASEKGDTEKLFTYGEKANAIVQKYKASSAPDGTTADAWTRAKDEKLASIKDDQNYLRESLFGGAYNATDPAKKADYFLRFSKMYPDTAEGEQALTMAASAYQQAQNRPKMLEVANGALAKDPNNIGMLLLLADDYSEKGDQLDKAEAYAKKAGTLADSAKKPDNLTDEQWQQQTSIQKGLSLSTLGQINLQKKLNPQAVDNLTKAAPLLKSNAVLYARNEYRLGFAYVNLKKNADATKAFTEAASVDSPYKGPAQQKLAELSGAKTAHKKAS
jgi:tetratricopeptide (TPR) repeat protein